MSFVPSSAYAYRTPAPVPDQPVRYAYVRPTIVPGLDPYLTGLAGVGGQVPFELLDFRTVALDDHDEYFENIHRPRLTKDQVDLLESQFQAHPKPNSNTKRQLAMRTNLTINRVSVRGANCSSLCTH